MFLIWYGIKKRNKAFWKFSLIYLQKYGIIMRPKYICGGNGMSKQNKIVLRNVIVVALLLAFAYVLRIILRPMESLLLPTALTIVRSTIHVTIVILWTVSLWRRVVNKQVQRILLSVGLLMAMWIIAKTIKYEFLPNNFTTLGRYIWYSYYIPMLLIPFLGLRVTQFIGKADTYQAPKWTYCFYIPAIFLVVGILTNDLHNLAFTFPNGIENYNADYSYNLLYWCAMAWYIGLGVAFVAVLLRKSRLPGSKKMQRLPLFIMIGAIAFWLLYTLKIINGDLTVIDCILIGSLLETAIQTGLIHTNSSYRELFESTTVPLVIVDEDFQARYTSGGAIPVDEREMRATENGTVALGDTLLSSAPICAGRVLWQDDVSELNRQRADLDDICETLSEEGVLIQAENEMKEKQAKAEEQNNLYDKIAREVKPQLEILDALLQKAEKGEETKKNLARVAIIGSYVKRRGNLLLVASNRESISVRELENAFCESSENLRLLDIETSLFVSGNGDIPFAYAIAAYDFYETVIEAVLDGITAAFIRLYFSNGSLKLSLQFGVKEGFDKRSVAHLTAPNLSVEFEDEDLYVDFVLGGEGR